VPSAPAAPCALGVVEYAHGCSQRRHRNHPAFPHANGFNGLWRALPGDEFVLPPSPANGWSPRPVGLKDLRRLDTSNGCQDHTLLPYATTPFVLRAGSLTGSPPCDPVARATLPRPPHPAPNVRDDSRSAPHAGRDGENKSQISEKQKPIIFRWDWRPNQLDAAHEIRFCAQAIFCAVAPHHHTDVDVIRPSGRVSLRVLPSCYRTFGASRMPLIWPPHPRRRYSSR
jgi:hypothetical protein